MKKRSKYRPRAVIANPVGFVLSGFAPVRSHKQVMVDLQIRHHAAMTALTRGEATAHDLDILTASINMTEAFYRLGVGEEYNDTIREALDSIRELKAQGASTERFVLNARQMNALNEALAVHDAQLDVVTVNDMEAAIKIVNKELAQLRAERAK